MFAKLRSFIDMVLRKTKLKPLSIGEKCRLQFGGAVLLILSLALMVPYFWMGKLTEKNALDSGRAIADMVFLRHFRLDGDIAKGLPALNETGVVRNPDELIVQWLRLNGAGEIGPGNVTTRQQKTIDELVEDEYRYDTAWIEEADGEIAHNNYVRVVRAMDACIVCHNQQGTATVFNKNEPVGALVTRTPARDVARTRLMNRLWIFVAGVMAAAGAMVAFYSIAQRIILRPIRQLRALVSNVSEGNLDARSAIKSGDEYEKLSDAFNAMLDGLQESQEKLRQANKTLDGKIAQLSDRNIELFKANKLKSEFLANMSHEVRTPLNAILGFAQILREKPAGDIDKSRRYAENIITSGRALLNMINDLLDLAKAEAGKMRLHLEQTSVLALCQGLVAFYYAMAEQHRVTIELNVEADIPLVTTDYGKVQQVLYNLLSNAIKFTPEDGKVVVSAKMLDEKTVRMSVTDTGPGIAEENYDKVFEKFRQVDGSITRQGDGSGLGLAICKELTELLAGEISIESTLGEGSTFHLDIPLVLSVS